MTPTVPVAPAAPSATIAVARPLPVTAVRLLPSGSLGAWQVRNAEATIPHCIENLETSGVLDNFRRVTGEVDKDQVGYRGFVFADSDLHKTIEAVAWEIGRSGTTAFDAWLDDVIGLLARAQEPDGYLMSAIQLGDHGGRWEKLEHTHELYVLGHMVQAAVALSRTAGRDDLLQIAVRFVDLVDATFGPDAERRGICGHPEIETALVELYRHTGEPRYLALAEHMIDLRGTGLLPSGGWAGSEYYQDHAPVREARTAVGHAVRQLYLDAGVTDLYLETGEAALLEVQREQWVDAHERKMYLSGAFGSRHRDEAFGSAYELPSDRAYAETCATIADLHWSWRMFLADGGSRYGDVIEREIHNALAASLDETGTRFFYSNPLQSRPDKHSEENAPRDRQSWYSCACCPPNIARAIAQLGGYVASVTEVEVALHQYSDADIDLPAHLGGGTLRVRTAYPADGVIEVRLEGAAPEGSRIALRIPSWSPATTVDGVEADADGYLRLDLAAAREGVRVELDVTPRLTVGHPRVDAVRGCVAIERGPVVQAVEHADLPDGVEVDDLRVLTDTKPEAVGDGVRVAAVAVAPPTSLYRGPDEIDAQPQGLTITTVPFASWGNRGPGAMRVWLPRA